MMRQNVGRYGVLVVVAQRVCGTTAGSRLRVGGGMTGRGTDEGDRRSRARGADGRHGRNSLSREGTKSAS